MPGGKGPRISGLLGGRGPYGGGPLKPIKIKTLVWFGLFGESTIYLLA